MGTEGTRNAMGRAARIVAGIAAIGALAATWQMSSTAGAEAGLTVTIESSADGTSSEPDAVEAEGSTYAAVVAALAPLQVGDATATWPTTIGPLPNTDVTGVVVQSDTGTATVALTGVTNEIFGRNFGTDISVLILADWDESNAADDAPRVVVSAQLADRDLGDLIGLPDGSVVADVPLPAGAISMINAPDATIPSGDDDLLDPTSFPQNAKDFFARIYGAELRGQLPLRSAVNFQAAIAVGQISDALNAAVGMDSTSVIALDGSVGVNPEQFSKNDGTSLAGLSLRTSSPSITLPGAVNDALGLDGAAFDAAFEIAWTDSGTPDDTSDDEARMAFEGNVALGDPLPSITATVAVEVIETGPDDVAITFSAGIGDWDKPFGIDWLSLKDLSLAATMEGKRGNDGGTPEQSLSVALEADADIGGKNVTVSIEGGLESPLNATLTAELNDSISLRELMSALGINPGSTVPAHVLDASFGPASLVVEIATEAGQDPVLTVSATGDFAFKLHASAANPVAATLFMSFSGDGTDNDFAVGVRPNGKLNLSDLVPGVTTDFELISDEAAFGFLFTTGDYAADELGGLDAAAVAFLGPLFGDDDTAEVDLPAGFSVLGSIELPDGLADFARNSLGLKPRVQATGTVPIDGTTGLDMSLALELDPTKTPDWIHAGSVEFSITTGIEGIKLELSGSLTVKFRSGLSPDLAADLAGLGINVYSDQPVSQSFDCPGAAQTFAVATASGSEFRCYDLLTFTVKATLDITTTPPSVSAELGLTLDTSVVGSDFGWQPFGLEWLTVNRVGMKVGINWDSVAPPPGVSLSMGFTGDVVIAGKDLLVAAKMSVQPVPYPPFAIVKFEGLRLASDAGFEMDDFFAIQHQIARAAARVQGQNPDLVDGPFSVNDIGIPNLALRNLDFSFSTDGDPDLCIPQGLFISADIYVNPTGEPTVRGPKCGAGGAAIPPAAGSTCGENKAKGCFAGARISVNGDGFTALAEINGFELGPITFDDAKLDVALTADDQHFLLQGGVTVDPIGGGKLQVSFERKGLGVQASFAGKLDVGPKNDPFFSALAEGSLAFDLTAIENSGIKLRVVLDASNLSIGELGRAFEEAASPAVDKAAADVIAVLDLLKEALTDFKADPVKFINDGLDDLGVDVPPALQPLVDGIAELLGEGFKAGEAAILRGELPGLPAGGRATTFGCPILETQVGSTCFIVPPTSGAPSGGTGKTVQCSALTPQLEGGRCYTILPSSGTPIGGADQIDLGFLGKTCPPLHIFFLGGRCYIVPPNNGTPSGGNPTFSACPPIHPFLLGGRCYTIPPTPGITSGNFPAFRCQNIIFPHISNNRCYTIPPIDVVGLCDAFGLNPNCTAEDMIERVVQPAVLATANITKAAFSEVANILEQIDNFFSLECAEFQLVLNGKEQSVGVSVTVKVGGSTKTFSLQWDLSKSLADNLTGLLDGIKGAGAGGCAPIDFVDFADDVFSNDGGELLNAPKPGSDQFVVDEHQTVRVYPLANDTGVDSGTITSFTVQRVGQPGNVTARIDAGGRSVTLAGFGPLTPGQQSNFNADYIVTNSSGLTAVGAVGITVQGVNEPPVAEPDFETLNLGVASAVDVDVLVNDFDEEDGLPGSIAAIGNAGSTGCAGFGFNGFREVMVVSDVACDGTASPYAHLAAGETFVDRFSYVAADSFGALAEGAVEVTVIGVNDAPSLTSIKTSARIADVGQVVTLTGTVVDPDVTDTHELYVSWGDNVVDELRLVPGQRTFRVEHRYLVGGFARLEITVFDDAGSFAIAHPTVLIRGSAAATVVDVDVDGDGYIADDCNSNDRNINPGAAEVPYDGIDNNCSGSDLVDVDGDGVAADRATGGTPDCDDTNNAIKPGATEVTDGVDNDCDGQTDENAAPFDLPAGSAEFKALSPERLFDTRSPEAPSGYLSAGSTLDVQVAGKLGIPSDASAVILNLTATQSDGRGFVTAWASGEPQPTASNLNLVRARQTVPNLVITPIGADGKVSFYTDGGVHLLADVAGYFLPLDTSNALTTGSAAASIASNGVSAGRFIPVDPTRVFDSRQAEPAPGPKGYVNAGETVTVKIAGSAAAPSLPSGISAAVVNVTATATDGSGHVTAFPSGSTQPEASSLNFEGAGDTTANLVVVPLGADGSIDLFSLSGTHLIVDIVGIFTDESAAVDDSGIFIPLSPERVFDTRFAPDPFGALGAGETIDVVFGGVAGIPANAGAVFATVTGTQTAGPGYVKVWAAGDPVPATSTVNFTGPGVTKPNAAIIDLGEGGAVSFFSLSGNHLLTDVAGYFTS